MTASAVLLGRIDFSRRLGDTVDVDFGQGVFMTKNY
jgi:hypothetical protein